MSLPAVQPLRPASRAQTVICRRRTFDCPHARREDRSCPPRWRAGHPLQGQQHNHQGQQTAHSHACCIGAYARTLAQHDNRIHRPHWRAGPSLIQQRNHQGQQAAQKLCLLPWLLRSLPCHFNSAHPSGCATTPQLIMSAKKRTTQGKASAHTTPRSTPTSSHTGGESLHAT